MEKATVIKGSQHSRASRTAFALVELLVVIGILVILAAIIFPVFAHVRENGREATCLSNVRQLATAITLYLQDNDESYPWSYTAAEGHVTWAQTVSPYIHGYSVATKGGILSCPDSGVTIQSYSTNPQVIGLIGPLSQGVNFFQSVVTLSLVNEPSSTVLLGDAITDNAGTVTGTCSNEFAYPHPSLFEDHTHDQTWRTGWAIPGVEAANNKQISWRHHSGAMFAFCDGHAKWARIGSLTDNNWDVRCLPGIGCRGHTTPPNAADYPAIATTCSNHSAIDCE